MKTKLLNKDELEWSPIVANNSMNRERVAFGVNSYEKEVNLNPVVFLEKRKNQNSIYWTDLCCGAGNALIQTSNYFKKGELSKKLFITGIDLVDFFSSHKENNILELQQMNLSHWKPIKKNDLITVIHGLHYIGDKIGLIINAASALKEDGIFIGNLDLNNIIIDGVDNSKGLILNFFRKNNISYNKRKKIIKIEGNKIINSKFIYIGADDKAGPNYTGQEVVNSFYAIKN